jgi:LuxR family maltose regulon positive regulatory protein
MPVKSVSDTTAAIAMARIADRMFVSKNTGESQMAAIYRKLGVSTRNDAVQKATAIGLLGA